MKYCQKTNWRNMKLNVANITDEPQQRPRDCPSREIVNLLHFIADVECSDRSGDERGNHLCITCQWLTPQQRQSGDSPAPNGNSNTCLYNWAHWKLPPVAISLPLFRALHRYLSLSLSLCLTDWLTGNLSSNQQSQKLPGNKTERKRQNASLSNRENVNANKPIEHAKSGIEYALR